jgi:hypothetical protein
MIRTPMKNGKNDQGKMHPEKKTILPLGNVGGWHCQYSRCQQGTGRSGLRMPEILAQFYHLPNQAALGKEPPSPQGYNGEKGQSRPGNT